jgi:cyclopropane fatty-acyl-phospholipid synthase-like methyltransferase
MEQTMDELLNHTADMGQAAMFSKDWYNEYFRRAATSPTHARFCEAVYGRDLCQHGMMDVEEMALMATLLKPGNQVLEIGCSNGHISEYLQQYSGCDWLGLDNADQAIAQAQARTQGKPGLSFQVADLINDPIPGDGFDSILAIDSIYFMGDYNRTLAKLNAKLKPGGQLIVAAFQAKEDHEPDSLLQAGGTRMDQALRELGLSYAQHDFTANVRNHWIKNYQYSHSLQTDFAAEGNAFLAEARMAENGWFKDHAERETLVRFLYVVERHTGST